MKKALRYTALTTIIIVLIITMFPSYSFASEEPSIKAQSAIIYCATDRSVLWSKKADKEMNLASITKLMTCLIAVEELGLDYEVEVTEEATQVSKLYSFVFTGEKITVKDLVYESLLISANDAAKALAIATSGSVKEFAKLMNERAKKIGCTHTHFVNANGVANDEHYSCARDIALIAEEAFKNDDIRKISGTAKYTVEATNKGGVRKLETTNLFLEGGTVVTFDKTFTVKKYDGVFAGKTGTTGKWDTTMVVGLDIEGFEVYCVILGSTLNERYNDMVKLMDYAKANISRYTVFEKGMPCGEVKIRGGAVNKVDTETAAEGFINLPEGASASLVTTTVVFDEDLQAPIEKGQSVGKIEIYIADEFCTSKKIIASESVKKGWFLSGLGITNFQTIIMMSVLLVIIVLIIFILIWRNINRRKKKKRREAKLREIARKQLEREKDVQQRNWPY